MITRKDYLERRVSHRSYYSQFITEDTKCRVNQMIGSDRLMKSKDPDFNDIPLKRWDIVGLNINTRELHNLMKRAGDYPTMAGLVCIAKEAGLQLVEENLPSSERK